MLASVASRRSALVLATSKTSPAYLSSIVGRSMSTAQERKDQDNILPVSTRGLLLRVLLFAFL
jgi:hypothetical protein